MFCFLPINALARGTLPPEEVKNASGLYNLTRNLGGAIGLVFANTRMSQWNNAHYAVLREAVTHGSVKTPALLAGLQERISGAGLRDSEVAALQQLYGVVMREAEVLTLDALLHLLGLVVFLALLLMPWVRKVSAPPPEAGGHRSATDESLRFYSVASTPCRIRFKSLGGFCMSHLICLEFPASVGDWSAIEWRLRSLPC